ncbi:MAG: hypothetical protein LBK64_05990, partial [Spirochaetaceae bacterium]|nr:hypothetical protein [Spirochaetaceae bacterium]
VVRAAASFREDGSGYMNIFDEQGTLTEEREYSPGNITLIVRYTYGSGRLQKAESSRIRPDRDEARDTAQEDAAQEDAPQAIEAQEDAVQGDTLQENELWEDAAQEFAAQENEPDAVSAGAETAPESTQEELSGEWTGPYIEEVLWTDVYRYSRSSALRSIERRYPEGMDGEERRNETAFFPGLPGQRAASRLVSPYSAFSSEFLMDILSIGAAVEFTTDERGRILTETRRDEEGEVLGTLTNVWTGDRLSSVSWETVHEIRRIEFEYDPDGNRTGERNYRDGVLERSVSSEGNRDVEELYLNGLPVLRAVWEDGRKVSEETLKPETGRN